MSYFLLNELENMEPYVPGEQPSNREYIKLNANESPNPPSPKVLEAIALENSRNMGYYADPNCMSLRQVIADYYHVDVEQVFVGNGADEVLGFCFMTFFRSGMKLCAPDITYDFYRTYAKTYQLDYMTIPLKEDFSVDINPYIEHSDRDVVIANPNNPTGLMVPVEDIEKIVKVNPKRMVIVDEAYIDYGNSSCLPLVEKYPNLIVVQTFSKSRNMAGLHIGYAISNKEIIKDMNSLKFTFNPFNLNSLTLAAGAAAVNDEQYTLECVNRTISIRDYTKNELEKLGFTALDTKTNFVMIQKDDIVARDLCSYLKEHGILVRNYPGGRIDNYIRITIGTKEQMLYVIECIKRYMLTERKEKICVS